MDDAINPTGGAGSDDRCPPIERPLSESDWEAADAAILRLEEAWQQGAPPDIATLLPPDADPAVQRSLLIKLVGTDLEWRWKTAGLAPTVQYEGTAAAPLPPRPRLADYAARYPLLGPIERLPVDLLVGEYYARCRYGDRPAQSEYLEAFGPLHADLAQRLQVVDDEIAAGGQRPTELTNDGPLPGSTVQYFGDYVLLERLGKGGMGIVYKARQISLKRLVAVKMILAGQLAGEQDVQRFHVEAEAAANLDHPWIVRIIEIGQHEGQHYFSMDFIDGQSLETRLKDNPLPPREAARLIEQVSWAIGYAHSRGVIHRDLKPANILVNQQGQPRVTDFGLAKRVQGDSSLTATGMVLGTPSYMPPEQAAGRLEQIGERSDVYSLGATLYALLSGRPPFQAATVLEVLLQVRQQDPVPLRQLNPHLPRDLETICAKCLEKDQRRRYGSAQELAVELKRFLAGKPIQSRPVSRPERLWRWCKRQPVVASLISAIALSLVVGILASSYFAVSANAQKEQAESQLLRARAAQYGLQIGDAQRDLLENNYADAEALLDECAPDLRGWEHRYLCTNLRKRRLLVIHGGGLGVAFSPDGRRIVSGASDNAVDNTVKVWDIATGRETITLRGCTQTIWSVAFSPDGRRIASGGGGGWDGHRAPGEIKVWDATTGQEMLTLVGHKGRVTSVAFSPDAGRIVSASADGTVKVWDAAAGKETLAFDGHTREVSGAAFSPDGRRIVSGGGGGDLGQSGEVKVWDAATGQETLAPRGHVGWVQSVAFSPDGRRIAAGSTDVTVWDAATGQKMLTLKGPKYGVYSVAFSADGRRVASASFDGTLMLWDAATGQERLTLRGHTMGFNKVAFSPDGQRIASGGSADGTVKIWDVGTGQETLTLTGHTGRVNSVGFSPDGRRIVSGSEDKTLKVWDAATGRQTVTLIAHNSFVSSVAFSPDGRRIASGGGFGDREVKVWDAATGQETLAFKGHKESDAVESVAFSPDGRRIASGGRDGTVKVWDAATGQETLAFGGHTGGVRSVAFSPDGRRIAAGSTDLRVWDAVAGREILVVHGGSEPLAFSPDGRRIVSAGNRGHFKVWDAATGLETLDINGHTEAATTVAFSPDGRRIASGGLGDGIVRVWDVATGQETLTLKGHTGWVYGVAFSPDGRRIASGSDDNTVKVWDAGTDQETPDPQAPPGTDLSGMPPPGPAPAIPSAADKYVYGGGAFAMYPHQGKREWVETKANGDRESRYAETGRDKDWIRLSDSSRHMVLRLPVGGGTAEWSTDDGKTWNAWEHVDREEQKAPGAVTVPPPPAAKEAPPVDKSVGISPKVDSEKSALVARPRPKSARMIYLVSADRTVREDFKKAIEAAAVDLQAWYAKQLGGPTFRLNTPAVEVAKSDKDANWFYSHRSGEQEDDWGFNNGLSEARRLVGARQGDPEYVWVIYSDGPGSKGRGGGGVAVLPEDDLLGLVGQHPEQKSVKRWIAGLGHELGHAFGLAHPRDMEKHRDALMATGIYGKYPDQAYLTEEDKAILMKSPFFFLPNGEPVVKPAQAGERYVYDGGTFAMYSRGGKPEWVESKADGSAEFRFTESGRDEDWIRLFDSGRNMVLRLPVGGGMCSWSTDGGKTWNALYRVDRAK